MDTIQVLERAFHILELVAAAPNTPRAVSELAEKANLKVPTASRIIRTMSSLGYLEFVGRKIGYTLGKKTRDLARNYQDQNPLRKAAIPYLREFRDKVGEYVCVSHLISDKRHIVALEASTRVIQVAIRMTPEVENPFRSVSGRVLMAGLDHDQRERCFKRNGPAPELWPNVITKHDFMAELDRISQLEALVERGKEMVMIARPIIVDGTVIAAIGSYIPAYRVDDAYAKKVLNALRDIADGVSKSVYL